MWHIEEQKQLVYIASAIIFCYYFRVFYYYIINLTQFTNLGIFSTTLERLIKY